MLDMPNAHIRQGHNMSHSEQSVVPIGLNLGIGMKKNVLKSYKTMVLFGTCIDSGVSWYLIKTSLYSFDIALFCLDLILG